jgi:hypothetical protein
MAIYSGHGMAAIYKYFLEAVINKHQISRRDLVPMETRGLHAVYGGSGQSLCAVQLSRCIHVYWQVS